MLLSTALLALAVATVWLPNLRLGSYCSMPPALLMLGVAVIAGLIEETVDLQGAIAVSTLVALAVLSDKSCRPLAKMSLSVICIALAFAMGSGFIPGFNDVVLVSNIRASIDAPAVRLNARFNIAATGLVLLLMYCRRSHSFAETKEAICSVFQIALLTTVVVLGLGCLVEFVRPDIKLPSFTGRYIFRTLFWTCVVEESFFRGVVQERLASSQILMRWPRMWWLPVAVSSALFGLAHMRGGWIYVVLATLAGIGYGMAYAKTRRIESSLFAHFFLNTAHFIGFTYPYLEGNRQ